MLAKIDAKTDLKHWQNARGVHATTFCKAFTMIFPFNKIRQVHILLISSLRFLTIKPYQAWDNHIIFLTVDNYLLLCVTVLQKIGLYFTD